jgi:hypothetical protein
MARFGRYGRFGDFTQTDLDNMNAVLDNVDSVILKQEASYVLTRANPYNYALETQRDAMTRAGNLLTGSQHNRDQLRATKDSVYASGDPAKMQAWLALADTITDAGAAKIFSQQLSYSSTANMVVTVAEDTAADLGNPFKWPWWLWAGAGLGALILLRPFAEAFTSSRKQKK